MPTISHSSSYKERFNYNEVYPKYVTNTQTHTFDYDEQKVEKIGTKKEDSTKKIKIIKEEKYGDKFIYYHEYQTKYSYKDYEVSIKCTICDKSILIKKFRDHCKIEPYVFDDLKAYPSIYYNENRPFISNKKIENWETIFDDKIEKIEEEMYKERKNMEEKDEDDKEYSDSKEQSFIKKLIFNRKR